MIDDFAVQGTSHRIPQVRLPHVNRLHPLPASIQLLLEELQLTAIILQECVRHIGKAKEKLYQQDYLAFCIL